MRILITGASGFIGRTFVKALAERGHDVVAVTRRTERAPRARKVRVLEVNPVTPGPWQETAAECDAAITLAGEHVAGRRWTHKRKALIRSSRIRSTQNIIEAWARAPRPRVLLGCSATHYYGARPSEHVLDETAGPGDHFFARTIRDWEAEAGKATDSGARVVKMRIGVVLGKGSALDYCVPMARACLGHIRGAGEACISWIHHEDNVGLMLHALDRQDIHGPLNMTAPGVVTWSHFMRTLARLLGRPFTIPVPRWAARLTKGEVAELWYGGHNVRPAKALATGYTFKHPAVEEALADVLRGNG